MLVPPAVIVAGIGGIDPVNEITTGEAVAIAISLLGGLAFIAVLFLRFTEHRRTYQLKFIDRPLEYLPSIPTEISTTDHILICASDVNPVVYTSITLRDGVLVDQVDLRFVRRQFFPKRPLPFPIWRWLPRNLQNDSVEVANVWDGDSEREDRLGLIQPGHRRQRPSSFPDGTGGYLVRWQPHLNLLGNDRLWLRVIPDVRADWKGYLEFRGPSKNRKRAYQRKRVDIRLSVPHTEESPTGEVE